MRLESYAKRAVANSNAFNSHLWTFVRLSISGPDGAVIYPAITSKTPWEQRSGLSRATMLYTRLRQRPTYNGTMIILIPRAGVSSFIAIPRRRSVIIN